MNDKRINILVVDDNPDDTRLVRAALAESRIFPFAVKTAGRLSEALKLFAEGGAEAVLLDLSLPDSQGVETVRRVARDFPDVPIVVMTRADDERLAVQAAGAGASRYIVKGQLDWKALPLQLLHAIERHRIRNELDESRRELELTGRFLEISNRHIGMLPMLQEFIREVRAVSGCEAIGVRILDAEGNLPYQAWEGFSRDFYERESPLNVKTDRCMCISVVKGTTDPARPFFTKGGSFHSNDTTRLLATISEEEKGETRNECNRQGYESVALVPILLGGKILGLIHLADRRRDMVGARLVGLLERAAMNLGTAIGRVMSAEALRRSKERYRMIVNNINDAVFLHGVEDDGTLGRFTEVNDVACRRLGYSREELMGKSPADIDLPGNEEDRASTTSSLHDARRVLFEMEHVAKDGRRIPVEVNAQLFVLEGRPVILSVARDVTERKRAESDLRGSLDRLGKSLQGTILAMAKMIETRDPYTAGHQQRVSRLAVAIAEEMDLTAEQVEGIRVGGILHDVGKIFVPTEILSKPGRISALEFQIIQSHSEYGYEILKSIDFPWPVARMAFQHHERMDGTGYPGKLPGKNIIIEAKIIGVADVVEAMTSHRPYRPALGIEKAMEEIREKRGVLYDPASVDACLTLFRDKGFKFE